jgi:hypothetical protein
MNRKSCGFVVNLVLCAVAATGQCVSVGRPPRQIPRLLKNQSQMKVQIVYDRKTPYFPGEALQATIITANPTSSRMEIFDPLEAAFYFDPEHCGGWPLKSVRTIIIKSGETISRSIDSRDEKSRARSFFPESASCVPGTYRGGFSRHAEEIPSYQVGTPVLEASAVVQIDGQKRVENRSVTVILAFQLDAPPQQPPVSLLRRNGSSNIQPASDSNSASRPREHVLAISQNLPRDVLLPTTPGETLQLCRLGRWTRLLTLPDRITSLSAATDHLGRVQMEYVTEDGVRHALVFKANATLGGVPVRY